MALGALWQLGEIQGSASLRSTAHRDPEVVATGRSRLQPATLGDVQHHRVRGAHQLILKVLAPRWQYLLRRPLSDLQRDDVHVHALVTELVPIPHPASLGPQGEEKARPAPEGGEAGAALSRTGGPREARGGDEHEREHVTVHENATERATEHEHEHEHEHDPNDRGAVRPCLGTDGIARLTWSYLTDDHISATIQGALVGLPDGDVLSTWGENGRLLRTTPTGDVAWEVRFPVGVTLGGLEHVASLYAALPDGG